MSYIPHSTLNMSQFSLDTGFDSVPGTQDPTYNPLIVDGLEVHQFFTTQTHMNGKYIEGITVDSNGIVFPQGYSYILDPFFYYSSGTTWRHSPHFIWVIDGVDQAWPKFASQYASDQNSMVAPNDSNNGRGYRGLKYLDCSLSSKTVKIRAVGPWSAMGSVYWDNQQTNASLLNNNKSHILIHAIPSADIANQTPRVLDSTQVLTNGWYQNADCIWASAVSQLPADALNKYVICTATAASTSYIYYTPSNPSVGDWLGFIITSNSSSTTFTVNVLSPLQNLVLSGVAGTHTNTCFGFKWTGARWVEVPFTSLTGLVKLPRT